MKWRTPNPVCVSPTLGEPESCTPIEICVNGLLGSDGVSQMASCVSKEYFVDLAQSTGADARGGAVNLIGMMASVVVSQTDATTPLGVGDIEVDSGVSATAGSTMKRRTCRDCFELSTRRFAPETDFLRTEATVVGTGSLAVTGILWMAVLSG